MLVAKPGLDGHDRGARVIVRALRDAGMEVIYTGLHQTPEMIVSAAQQEDPDVICVSILSGAHMTVFPRLMRVLKEKGAEDIIVAAGGVIPDDDIGKLTELGVRKIMLQDTPPDEIVRAFRELVAVRGPR